FNRFEPFLMPNRNTTEDFPIPERAECACPSVIAKSGKRFTKKHHVRFCDAGVERPPLIDEPHSRLKSAARGQVRINRNHVRRASEDLHRSSHYVSSAVFLFRIENGKKARIVTNSLVPWRDACRDDGADQLFAAVFDIQMHPTRNSAESFIDVVTLGV